MFFKELKQTLQLAGFLGHNAKAVRWQVWTALLVYLLLRFCAFLSHYGHSFTRLFALLRSALWQKLELRSLLEVYGTAGGGGRFLGTPQQTYLGPDLTLWDSQSPYHPYLAKTLKPTGASARRFLQENVRFP